MKPRLLISLFLSLVFVLQPLASAAMETDQYNLPPVPLADIGDEVSDYIEDDLYTAVAKVNGEIARLRACVSSPHVSKGQPTDYQAQSTLCAKDSEERAKLAYLRSNDAVANELYKLLGEGNIFVSPVGKWLNTHDFQASPSRYKTGYFDSIYVAAPQDYATLSPTVRLFGVEFGTDKLDHFFQQGYKYYKIEKEAASKGATPEQAANKAVKWGQMTERTYFGLLISGVYSNADLYANYAGMKFYQSLTEPLPMGDKTRPAPVFLNEGVWNIDPATLRENLLKPFLTNHLNEALNPSGYAFTIFASVRRAVKNYACPEWHQTYPDLTADTLTERSKALELWNGEDYGYTKRGRTVNIGDTCFQNRTNP